MLQGFPQFVSWLFGLVFIGFISFFWWWLSHEITKLNKNLTGLEEAIQTMRTTQTKLEVKLDEINVRINEHQSQMDSIRSSIQDIYVRFGKIDRKSVD